MEDLTFLLNGYIKELGRNTQTVHSLNCTGYLAVKYLHIPSLKANATRKALHATPIIEPAFWPASKSVKKRQRREREREGERMQESERQAVYSETCGKFGAGSRNLETISYAALT